MAKLATKLLLLLIRVYQKAISPFLPARCRYYPTCSEYGKLALLWHGPWRGLSLATRRVLRCHPLGGQGLDFVPLPLYQDTFVIIDTPTNTLSSTKTSITYNNPCHLTDSQSIDRPLIRSQATVYERSMLNTAPLWLPERGVFKDSSSYNSRLNRRLTHSSHKLGS